MIGVCRDDQRLVLGAEVTPVGAGAPKTCGGDRLAWGVKSVMGPTDPRCPTTLGLRSESLNAMRAFFSNMLLGSECIRNMTLELFWGVTVLNIVCFVVRIAV